MDHVRVLCGGTTLLLPLKGNNLERTTLKSQFPNATGLKYTLNGEEVAVPAAESSLLPPHGGWGDRTYSVVQVAESAANARDVMNRPGPSNLAQQVAAAFRNSSTSSYQKSHFTGTSSYMSRKEVRQKFCNKHDKKDFKKSIRVVFVKNEGFPSTLNASIILEEGLIDIGTKDSEESIRQKLLDLFNDINVTDVNQLCFLTCSHKKLSIPNVSPAFKFDGIGLKTLVGQGKLYVGVKCYKKPRDDDNPDDRSMITYDSQANAVFDYNDTDDKEKTQSHGADTESEDSGTPTITFRPRSNRLKLRSNSTVSYVETAIPTATTISVQSSSTHNTTPSLASNYHSASATNSGPACSSDSLHTPYRSYISLFNEELPCITVSDDDDDEVTLPYIKEQSLTELLMKLKEQIDNEHITKFNISRNNVIDGARRAIQRKKFNPKYKLSVKFTDDIGVAEGAVDEGGPKREFLRLLMRRIQALHVFEGPNNKKMLTINSSALEDNLYRDVGTFISISIVHGGPPPQFMSPLMFEALIGSICKSKLQMDDILDLELKKAIQKLKESQNLAEINEVMESGCISTLLVASGCYQPIIDLKDRDRLVQDLIKFVAIDRSIAAFHQLQNGLRTLGVYQMMVENTDTLKELFTHRNDEKLTAEMVEVIFLEIKLSPEGSNKRAEENRTVGYWRDFLIDIEDADVSEVSLEEIVAFATGADKVPPLGFDPTPCISFIRDGNFPMANTCSMELKLPILQNYEIFKKNMTFGIANSPGFGLV